MYGMILGRSRTTRIAALAVVLSACGPDSIVNVRADAVSRTVGVAVGQELRIPLWNAGPTLYENPPQMSSDVLAFVGVEVVPPFNPGGPTQEFRFKALREGVSLIRFRKFFLDSVVYVVEDTVLVHR